MAHRSLVYGLFLGMVGFALASGCVVKSDDDDGGGGEAGESSGGEDSGGSSTGGSSTGGRGGSATGGTSTGGTSTGGTSTGGTSTGGMAGMDTDPVCDPDDPDMELDNTYYPDCAASPNNPCEECIQESCCEESRICYGYDPGNVCGWGGPDGDGEINCYITCAQYYVADNDGVFDEAGIDECTAECTTEMCGQIGRATQDLAVCLQLNCEDSCWPAP